MAEMRAPTIASDKLHALEWRLVGPFRGGRVVAVAGHPMEEQTFYFGSTGGGVWKTTDGGIFWENISDGFFKRASVGAIALAIDPHNPRVLFAAFWEAYRGPHELISGGPGSGIFRSMDGGDTWTEITHKPGLPKGVLGKIGLAVSPAKRDRLWAIVES